jgi:L-fuculose-phosphate aldolase
LALDGCLLPEIIASLGMVPLTDYGTPGTAELPAAVHGWITSHDALLLANHGVVTTATSLTEAYYKLESVERLAQVTLLARLAGGEQRLSAEKVAAVRTLAARPASGDTAPVCVSAEHNELAPSADGSATPAAYRDNDLERIADRLARVILAELG